MPKLINVRRLFADGYHNAFTDLLHWNGHYYLSFRTAHTHGLAPPGDVVVYRSRDLDEWDLCARLDTGADDRDPKLIDAGDRLGVVFGSWFPRWHSNSNLPNAPHDLISHVSVSRDGLAWSAPRQVYGVNYWLWRILPTSEGFFCAAYHFAVRADRDMRTVHLLHSDDLFDWRLKGLMRSGGGSGEPALFRAEPDCLHCIIRTLEPRHHSWIGRSPAPYSDWEWTDLGVMIHAPAVLKYGDSWIVAGRSQKEDLPSDSGIDGAGDPDAKGHHTSVWRIDGARAVPLLTLPSGGDCSYPGLAVGPDGEIAMSYYSQHEWMPLPSDPPNPSDIFLARFRP